MSGAHAGHGDMARHFGASVNIEADVGAGLFLLVGDGVSPRGAVAAAGGNMVVEFPGTVKILAVLPVVAESAVRRHPDVALVGPVTVDPRRFQAFATLAGLDERASEEPDSV